MRELETEAFSVESDVVGASMSNSSSVVLVVDDEEHLAEFYAELLEEQYEVRTAYRGQEALEEYGPEVEVVLLDRRMPDLSGREVLDRLSEQPSDCRVAMVTAVKPEPEIVKMEFDDYLLKPVEEQKLHETVEQLLALTTYDKRLQEYHALTAKQAVLTIAKSEEALAENEEYSSLEERIEEIQAEFEQLREELGYRQLQNAFDVIDFEAPAVEQR
jgi:DNA-binding response OmpR family regulator